jgi:hypothetical protein
MKNPREQIPFLPFEETARDQKPAARIPQSSSPVPAPDHTIEEENPNNAPPDQPTKDHDLYVDDQELKEKQFKDLMPRGVSFVTLEHETPLGARTKLVLESSGIYYTFQYRNKRPRYVGKISGRGNTRANAIAPKETFEMVLLAAKRIFRELYMTQNQPRSTWHDGYYDN